MPLRLLVLLALACGLLAGPARALDPGKGFQHYVRDTWSVLDGMPHGAATAIAQTPDGYVWVGTQVGVARFDGVGFTAFTPADTPALPHPMVQALATDAQGALWVGTRGGMAVFRDGRFHEVPWAGDGEPPLIQRMHVDHDDRVWATTLTGVAYVEDGRLRPLPGIGSAIAVTTTDGVLWVSEMAGGVMRWDGSRWSATAWPGGMRRATDLMVADGQVWAATGTGLYIHGASGWEPVPGASGAEAMETLFAYRDGDGNVWAGGDHGLLRVRPDRRVDIIPATRENGLALMFSAMEDREGNLWLISMSTGLIRLHSGWTRRYGIGEGLPDATAWTVAVDPGGEAIWVGTNIGLARLGRDGRFTAVATGPEVSDAVIELFAEPGHVWIGLRDGLAHYRPGSGEAAAVPEWARDLRAMVRGISRDADGHLWIGTSEALLRWDGTRLERFDESRGLVGTLAAFQPIDLRDGRRIAMTTSGLFEFDGQAFAPAPESADLPADVILHAFTELSDGRLLLYDLNDFLLLRHQDRWHRVDPAHGLAPGTVHRLVEHDGRIWVSGIAGAYRVELEELTALAEGRIDRLHPEMLLDNGGAPGGGLTGACCNSYGLHNGFIAGQALWLPTSDGVVAIDIDDILRNPHPPGVRIGRIQAGEQWQAPARGERAVFEAGERDLTLAFDVLSFRDPRSNQARYRLAGYDRDWQAVAPMVREVRYTNLPPGDYAFEVLASNNDGVWTPEPARVEFTIRPYFHETLAFRLLLAAIAALLVYAGYRLQRHRHRLRQAELERLVDERTEALADSNQQLAHSNSRLGESNRKLADSNRRLEEASFTDPLTGLRNRRYLTQQLPTDLNYYDRQLAAGPAREDAVVFAMLDLDHFKQVNDAWGHATGDRVLEEAARRLKALVRAGDYVVRWGGEEFLLVFRPMPAAHVSLMGGRLRAAISGEPFDIGEGRSLDLTASVGLSEYPLFRNADGPLDWEAMIELADQAAYYVKRHGRDGWAMFRPTATTRMDSLLADLQRDPVPLLRAGGLELAGSVTDRADAAG